MPRIIRPLEIINMRIKDTKDVRTYSLFANGIELKVDVPLSDIRSHGYEEVVKAVNDRFLNSLRIIKHTGDLPRGADNKTLDKELNKWSTTNTGIAIKPKNDTVKEFQRFT